MNDEHLLRYSRHILIDEIGLEKQALINQAHVLVLGAGGLGSPALMYLAAAGCGTITVVDHDCVDLTNLQRQVIHTTPSVGESKVDSARAGMLTLNPHIQVNALQMGATEEVLDTLIAQADVVLDCTDNFQTRQLANAACVTHQKPLISGAAIRWDAQISVFDSRHGDSPCYACLYAPQHQPQEIKCATMGVFAPLTGITGAMQAGEALKVIMGVGDTLVGRLLLFNALQMEWITLQIKRNPNCPVCGSHRQPIAQLLG